ncbi:FecCD family ABC transporter permease [Halomonas sp. AOP42-C1-46]|uniref:FecCD family ABC transporter permease n=2 Tax=Halomonas TaxID=2745 RepID=UPI00403327E1
MNTYKRSIHSSSEMVEPVTLSAWRASHWLLLSLLLIATVLIGLSVGRYSVALDEIVAILYAALRGDNSQHMDALVILNVRLPRILLAGVCGAGLAICGVALQTLFRNPLVSPKVLGLSSGSALGGSLAILAGVGGPLLMGATFVSAFAALLLVVLISNMAGRTLMTIVLAGIVIDALFAAGISLVQYAADPETNLPAIVFWLMGSFATASWEKFAQTAPILIASIYLLNRMRYRIAVLAMGDDEAKSFGIHVARSRMIVFALISIIIGACVTASGVVGWVGLVIPHFARMLVGEDHRRLYFTSLMLGATFMILTDTLARSLTAAEIPLGVLTALVGAPVFVYLLCTRRRERA